MYYHPNVCNIIYFLFVLFSLLMTYLTHILISNIHIITTYIFTHMYVIS